MPTTPKKTAATKAGTKPAGTVYSFDVETADASGKTTTKTYHLPKLNERAGEIPGRYTVDAIMHPENETAQMALAFAMLNTLDIPTDVRAALLNLPTSRLLPTMQEWMGESSGSSAS